MPDKEEKKRSKGSAAVKSGATKKKAAAKKKTASKKVVAKKKVAKKSVAVARKTVARKKVSVSRAAKDSRRRGTVDEKTLSAIDNRTRYEMVAKMAYFRAEKRGFEPGWELEDWLESERMVDRMLGGKE